MAETKRNKVMSVIKTSMSFLFPTHILKYFCTFRLIKDLTFLVSVKPFPFVVVPDIDVALRQHGCEERLQRQSVCAAV